MMIRETQSMNVRQVGDIYLRQVGDILGGFGAMVKVRMNMLHCATCLFLSGD